jgi:hypothetical protein
MIVRSSGRRGVRVDVTVNRAPRMMRRMVIVQVGVHQRGTQRPQWEERHHPRRNDSATHLLIVRESSARVKAVGGRRDSRV